MCRNITILRGLQPPATAEEIEAAARQYVRKVSGATKPPTGAEAVFEQAIAAVRGGHHHPAGRAAGAPPTPAQAAAHASPRSPLTVSRAGPAPG